MTHHLARKVHYTQSLRCGVHHVNDKNHEKSASILFVSLIGEAAGDAIDGLL
jgi:hypothetical protein